MNNFKLVCLLFIFCSCSTNNSVIGLYGKCGTKYLACNQIELKSDNTFEYFVFMDVGGGTVIKGKWEQISSDTIKLNTYEQPQNPTTTFVGKNNPEEKEGVTIIIADLYHPLEGANIWVNGEVRKVADRNGSAEFKVNSINSIRYQYLGKDETIEIDNSDYNEISITISDLDVSAIPRFLTDQIMVVKNKKLHYNEWFSLKKTRVSEKQWK